MSSHCENQQKSIQKGLNMGVIRVGAAVARALWLARLRAVGATPRARVAGQMTIAKSITTTRFLAEFWAKIGLIFEKNHAKILSNFKQESSLKQKDQH